MNAVAAVMRAGEYAGDYGPEWNRRWLERLQELGFELVLATNPRPLEAIDAPIPCPEGDPLFMWAPGSMIVPISSPGGSPTQ